MSLLQESLSFGNLVPLGADRQHSYEWQQISGSIVPRSDMAEYPRFRVCTITGVVHPVKLPEASEYLPVVSAVTLRHARAAFEVSDDG